MMKDGMKHDNVAKPAKIQNVDAPGIAMKGFDAVAYFIAAKPIKGAADFEAMGVAYNGKFDIDPDAWKVEDGKLYLNKDMKTQQMWFKDIPGNIVEADKNWPVLGAVK